MWGTPAVSALTGPWTTQRTIVDEPELSSQRRPASLLSEALIFPSQPGGVVAVSCGQYAVEGLRGDAELTHSSL